METGESPEPTHEVPQWFEIALLNQLYSNLARHVSRARLIVVDVDIKTGTISFKAADEH